MLRIKHACFTRAAAAHTAQLARRAPARAPAARCALACCAAAIAYLLNPAGHV